MNETKGNGDQKIKGNVDQVQEFTLGGVGRDPFIEELNEGSKKTLGIVDMIEEEIFTGESGDWVIKKKSRKTGRESYSFTTEGREKAGNIFERFLGECGGMDELGYLDEDKLEKLIENVDIEKRLAKKSSENSDVIREKERFWGLVKKSIEMKARRYRDEDVRQFLRVGEGKELVQVLTKLEMDQAQNGQGEKFVENYVEQKLIPTLKKLKGEVRKVAGKVVGSDKNPEAARIMEEVMLTSITKKFAGAVESSDKLAKQRGGDRWDLGRAVDHMDILEGDPLLEKRLFNEGVRLRVLTEVEMNLREFESEGKDWMVVSPVVEDFVKMFVRQVELKQNGRDNFEVPDNLIKLMGDMTGMDVSEERIRESLGKMIEKAREESGVRTKLKIGGREIGLEQWAMEYMKGNAEFVTFEETQTEGQIRVFERLGLIKNKLKNENGVVSKEQIVKNFLEVQQVMGASKKEAYDLLCEEPWFNEDVLGDVRNSYKDEYKKWEFEEAVEKVSESGFAGRMGSIFRDVFGGRAERNKKLVKIEKRANRFTRKRRLVKMGVELKESKVKIETMDELESMSPDRRGWWGKVRSIYDRTFSRFDKDVQNLRKDVGKALELGDQYNAEDAKKALRVLNMMRLVSVGAHQSVGISDLWLESHGERFGGDTSEKKNENEIKLFEGGIGKYALGVLKGLIGGISEVSAATSPPSLVIKETESSEEVVHHPQIKETEEPGEGVQGRESVAQNDLHHSKTEGVNSDLEKTSGEMSGESETNTIWNMLLGSLEKQLDEAQVYRFNQMNEAQQHDFAMRLGAIGDDEKIDSGVLNEKISNGYITFGLFATDDGASVGRDWGQGHADIMIVVSLNPSNGHLVVTNIPRYVKAPEINGRAANEITWDYRGQGNVDMDGVREFTENVTGQPVDGVLLANIDAMKGFFDFFFPSGMEVTITEGDAFVSSSMMDDNNHPKAYPEGSTHVMSFNELLMYVNNRKGSAWDDKNGDGVPQDDELSASSSFARERRAEQLVTSLMKNPEKFLKPFLDTNQSGGVDFGDFITLLDTSNPENKLVKIVQEIDDLEDGNDLRLLWENDGKLGENGEVLQLHTFINFFLQGLIQPENVGELIKALSASSEGVMPVRVSRITASTDTWTNPDDIDNDGVVLVPIVNSEENETKFIMVNPETGESFENIVDESDRAIDYWGGFRNAIDKVINK